jgi:hypothetical protein
MSEELMKIVNMYKGGGRRYSRSRSSSGRIGSSTASILLRGGEKGKTAENVDFNQSFAFLAFGRYVLPDNINEYPRTDEGANKIMKAISNPQQTFDMADSYKIKNVVIIPRKENIILELELITGIEIKKGIISNSSINTIKQYITAFTKEEIRQKVSASPSPASDEKEKAIYGFIVILLKFMQEILSKTNKFIGNKGEIISSSKEEIEKLYQNLGDIVDRLIPDTKGNAITIQNNFSSSMINTYLNAISPGLASKPVDNTGSNSVGINDSQQNQAQNPVVLTPDDFKKLKNPNGTDIDKDTINKKIEAYTSSVGLLNQITNENNKKKFIDRFNELVNSIRNGSVAIENLDGSINAINTDINKQIQNQLVASSSSSSSSSDQSSLSPDQLSPDQLSPDQLSPDQLSPTSTSTTSTSTTVTSSSQGGSRRRKSHRGGSRRRTSRKVSRRRTSKSSRKNSHRRRR